MLKLIVFDWDGTLADSIGKIIACKKLLAKKYDLSLPSDATIKSVIGIKFEEALGRCFPQASKDVLQMLGEDFHILMQQDDNQAMLFPEVKDVLAILKSKGFILAIATSKNRNELDIALKHHNLLGMFDMVCCSDEYQGKPHPSMLQHIMINFNVSPEETLMIGDTSTDIIFAKNAGVIVICVTFGAHDFATLQSMAPYALINNFGLLPRIIDTLCGSPTRISSPFLSRA